MSLPNAKATPAARMSMATANRATNTSSLTDTLSGSLTSRIVRSSGRFGRRQRGGDGRAGRVAGLLLPGSGLRLRDREHAGQLGDRLLLPPGQGGEAPRQLEQQPLLGRRQGGLAQALEEVAGLDPERPRERVQPPGGDAVEALLVLVGLLVGDADQPGQLLLRQPEHDPPLAHPRADVAVDVLRAGATRPSRRRLRRRRSPQHSVSPATRPGSPGRLPREGEARTRNPYPLKF